MCSVRVLVVAAQVDVCQGWAGVWHAVGACTHEALAPFLGLCIIMFFHSMCIISHRTVAGIGKACVSVVALLVW